MDCNRTSFYVHVSTIDYMQHKSDLCKTGLMSVDLERHYCVSRGMSVV